NDRACHHRLAGSARSRVGTQIDPCSKAGQGRSRRRHHPTNHVTENPPGGQTFHSHADQRGRAHVPHGTASGGRCRPAGASSESELIWSVKGKAKIRDTICKIPLSLL